MFEEEFSKLPVEPPRRVESLPGLRLRGVLPKWAIAFPLIFIAFFLFIPLSVMNTDPAMRMAMGATDTVQGHVLSTSSGSACRGGASRRVVYSFSSKAGREYRRAVLLCEESPYFSLKEGDAIEVRYLSSDPTLNVLPSEAGNEPPPLAVFFLMPIFFLGFFGAMFWPSVGEVFRARRLFKSGRITTGKVIFVKRRANFLWPGMPGSNASVYIEIQALSGTTREVVASCHNDWLVNQLEPGATVHVAYAEDKSQRVALLDAFLR